MTAAVGVILFAPAAAATWRITSAAYPYIAASAALESLYLLLLTTAYARSDTGFVYPIARGTAPVLVLVISALALHGHVTAPETAGVLLVAGGIVLVRGLNGPESASRLALAAAIGVTIAGYTLVDKHGIAHAAPLAYLETVLAITAAANLAGTWRAKGAAALRRALNRRTIVAGAGFVGSYALVLAALRLAPAPPVAAVRESSVVIATAYLALSGREPAGRRRLAGAVAVAGGIALISLA